MLEYWLIRLLWSLSEICKSVIKIFWDEVFMDRNTMKTGQPFLATISVTCSRRSDRRESAKRCKQEKRTSRGWEGWLGVPVSLPPLLFLLIFFSRSLPSHRTPLSECLEQATISVGTLQLHLFFFTGFNPVWPKPACTCRTSPIAARCKRPDVDCLREVKETRGRGRRPQRAS